MKADVPHSYKDIGDCDAELSMISIEPEETFNISFLRALERIKTLAESIS